MRITQGCFSFLPDLTTSRSPRRSSILPRQRLGVGVEYTDDPHPRNTYWEMWGNPMFDLKDAKGVMMELEECRKAHPDAYIRINAFDDERGIESVKMSFIVNRPPEEPKLHMQRTDFVDRAQKYAWDVRS
jgi:ribulose-bisphosphate carboxylase small chain